jgi:hypothetical protein
MFVEKHTFSGSSFHVVLTIIFTGLVQAHQNCSFFKLLKPCNLKLRAFLTCDPGILFFVPLGIPVSKTKTRTLHFNFYLFLSPAVLTAAIIENF